MTTLELLSHLRGLDVQLWLEGERLRYSAPQGVMTPELLAQLAGRKQEVIAFLREMELANLSGASSIRPAQRGERIPLSFAQERLWVFDQLELHPAVYNIPSSYRLTGRLNVEALERSLNEIVRRHEILRTSFAAVGGDPVQLISPPTPFKLDVLDLSGLEEEERERTFREVATEEARQPFDLAGGPVFRARLLKLGDEEHVLLVNIHHIAFDGWSLGIFIGEVAALYEAFSAGRPSPLAELPVQYADYSIWQREWLSGPFLDGQLDYWRRRLGGELPVLDLPTDRPRPAVQSFRGTHLSMDIPAHVIAGLRELSQRHGTTLFMTTLAAFKALLYRYTGQEDVLVGTPVANRNRAETESLIGFFGNTLVLRTDLSGEPSFLELLGRVRETALEAFAHQDLPFEKLVDELQPRRDMSRTPLFQVMFVFNADPATKLEVSGVTFTALPRTSGTSKFDLTFGVAETPAGVSVYLEYNTDLFDAETIARMLGHYKVLAEGILADPHQSISALPLITPEERRQLLTAAPYAEQAPEVGLKELFEVQAERTPEAVAVKCGGESLTYAELNRRANRVGNYLRRLGVGPDVLVGVCVERSCEMVVGLLGAIKAGGAYLPLDPSYPKERLAFMLEDAGASVLLTQEHLAERVSGSSARVLCLDRDWAELADESEENPPAAATPENLAYVIYTSGSTGRPKGAMVSHRNVTRLFSATRSWFNFDERDVWTLFHSYAFDFSVWELWGALLYGGRLVVVPYLVSRNPEAFYELLAEERVTVLNQTPSAFRQLMSAEESLGAPRDLSLRLIIFGGEALELRSLKPWFERHGDTAPQLVNMYGITETTVHVTYRPLTSADAAAAQSSLIGGPIPDLRLYVLDRHQQLAPVGVAGELYVGGAGLARGYLNRPDLTAQRFIPDPFSGEPGARLYRTGDLARRLPDGDLEYLGRIDNQVKIRGFRIELGEIEAVLNQHAGVREGLVVARGASDGEKRLVAYFVPRGEGAPSLDELRAFLKERLPAHMVPVAFVTMERLPLTTNGKLDYKALPEPDRARPELLKSYVAPRTPVEEALAEIWARVLELERVGIHDNFFDLGGDSIRSIRIRAEARQLNLDFSVQQLFRHQTIAELAAVTISSGAQSNVAKTQPFSLVSEEDRAKMPPGVEDAYPLTMLQTGMIFHSTYSPDSSAYHNVSSVRIRAPFDAAKFDAALQQLTARHPVLRTSFDLVTFSEPLQLVHRTAEMPLRIEDLRALSHEEQEEVINAWVAAERDGSFDLSRAPLARFHIHLRTDETFQFSWAEHHAILDGWSAASMTTELFRLYTSLLDGEGLAVGPAPVSVFRDYVALERAALDSEEARQFWSRKLSDSTPTVVPRWRTPRREGPARQNYVQVPISKELSDGLKSLAREVGVPLKSVLLAAHLRVLGLLSGQKDVVTGVISNGRLEEVDGERALGLFLNAVPLRLKMTGGTWLDLIRGTFEAEQEMLPFRRFPLAELQRLKGGAPVFETTFNYVYFHVAQNLGSLNRIQFLEGQEYAETNYNFKANFSLDLDTNDLQLALGYMSTELCDEQIEAISAYYANALEAMVREPSGRYESTYLLPPHELRQTLSEWNSTAADYEREECIHRLFEAQARRTPDTVAVRFGEESLTFRELDRRASLLGRHLRALGVGPDVFVGLYLGRSIEMLVGLLGVLKAGGAYVPLDPEYPRERLSFMLEDTRAPVLVTLESLAGTLPASGARVVRLDADWPEIERAGERPGLNGHAPAATARNLAYVIYTSGSTGRPKGVLVEHRSLVNYVQGICGRLGLGAGAGYALTQPLTVDASLTAIYPPLVTGGCIHIFNKEQSLDARLLSDYFSRHPVDCLKIAPSHLAALQLWPKPEQLMPRKCLVIGGEAPRYDWVAQLQALAPDCRILNQYGPTEATVAMLTCWFEDEGAEGPRPLLMPTGRPLQNTRVYLLDEDLQPVPVGTPGELYIGGDCLARGYLNRPDLTAASFIPNPFAETPGERLYRTGDLARYLPDGDVEFIGRRDQQVKIRGFRVETGEIEAALARHRGVRESFVMAREDVPGDRRLVAYVVSDLEPSSLHAELRGFLKERLPEHMLPDAFVQLEALPLTPHGKIDIRAFPAPEEVGAFESEQSFVGPRDELERQLVEIWEESLRRRPISVTDSFFDLGGNSITAVRLMAQVQKRFERSLPLSTLFSGATVEQMAGILRGPAESRPFSPLVEIRPGGAQPPFFCVHPVGGSVFCYYELANSLKPEQPFYGLQARGLEEGQLPLTRVEEMAAYYLKAIRERQAVGPYYLGGWSLGGVVAFEMARQLRASGESVALLALMDSYAPSPSDAKGFDDAELMTAFLLDLCRVRGADLSVAPEELAETLRQLEPSRRLGRLLEQAKRQELLPEDADLVHLRRLFETFKANHYAAERYTPGSFDGHVVLFRADGEEEAFADPSRGWRQYARHVEVHDVPGDHYSILSQPQVRVLAAGVRSYLDETQPILVSTQS